MAAPVNLRKVVDEGLINSFSGLARGGSSSSSTALADALNGNSQGVSISSGLRLGARAFAGAVQGVNAVIGYVNIVQTNLAKLSDLADELIEVTERAADPSTGVQTRRRLNLDFKRLGEEFVEVLDDTEISDRTVLDIGDLKEIFVNIGLDEDDSQSVQEVFQSFLLNNEDTKFADDEIKGERPADIPAGAYKIKTGSGTKTLSKRLDEFTSIFASQRKIDRRPDAYLVLNDLKALKSQIETNQEALDNAFTFLESNLELVRTAGFAFLELSEQVRDDEEAIDVARQLRKAIRKAPAQALAQAENLEPLAVAALAFEEGDNVLGDNSS